MLGLIVAGEAVYALPFHVTRFFRPTVLEVFGLSNTELGTAQAVYGIVAMLAYFPGGPLADRFSAGKLLALSLWTTAAGGLYMATLPGYRGAIIVWGIFGITTILLFWAALIRATRDWGGHDEQGRAYGFLDGGRGVLAAALGTLGAAVMGMMFPEDQSLASFQDKKDALRVIIHGYSLFTLLAGFLVWFVIREPDDMQRPATPRHGFDEGSTWAHIRHVLGMPAVWMQALIVVCAYVGYKGFDNYSLYAVEAWGMNEVDAAGLAALAAWMRPVGAIGAGLLGDRFCITRMTLACFAVLLCSYLVFALLTPDPGWGWLLVANMLIGSLAMFGLRGLYFALFEEARVPASVTGTAVGLVSVLGFTPDIFVGYVGGVLLDGAPGVTGHQHFFIFLSVFAALGVLVSALLVLYLARERAAATAPADAIS